MASPAPPPSDTLSLSRHAPRQSSRRRAACRPPASAARPRPRPRPRPTTSPPPPAASSSAAPAPPSSSACPPATGSSGTTPGRASPSPPPPTACAGARPYHPTRCCPPPTGGSSTPPTNDTATSSSSLARRAVVVFVPPPPSSSAVYWLYYTGSNDARLASPFPAADVAALPGLAISQDGRHWARIEGGHHTGALLGVGEDHPHGWEKRCAAAPKVVMHADGDLRMYYHSFDEMSQRHAVGVARSRDGIRWERVGKALEEAGLGRSAGGGCGRGMSSATSAGRKAHGLRRRTKLLAHIEEHGHGSWRALPSKAGLQRCGKSCRLRWTNYLRPDIKRGKFSLQEEQTIIQLHALLGNRWSAIATHLSRRTDNEIKNYWNTHLKKRLAKMGIDPVTHKATNGAPAGTAADVRSAKAARASATWPNGRAPGWRPRGGWPESPRCAQQQLVHRLQSQTCLQTLPLPRASACCRHGREPSLTRSRRPPH
ncbi:hypothetical protein ZWY2020_011908 [Hordeum vulgare]|nr:hypothetical protein ZWY2020_011908 [Hordeum vulgare]